MNRIYIEPPPDKIGRAEWRQEQISRLYEAIAKRAFTDEDKLGEILLALVKLHE